MGHYKQLSENTEFSDKVQKIWAWKLGLEASRLVGICFKKF